MNKLLKVFLCVFIIVILLGIVCLIINAYVKSKARGKILEGEDYSKLTDVDCIIVLGAGIWGDKPSPMLEDRLLEAIKLYNNKVAPKIIMSGDHGKEDYDEVNIMKDFAIENGVPSEDIFMDHAGFSSYESMYRSKEIFGVKKAVVVTQKYHLYRALYIANELGIEAYGIGSDPRRYVGEAYRELREILARNKDFIKCIFKPEPKYLGEKIDITLNGNVTNDKQEVSKLNNSIKLEVNGRELLIELENNSSTKALLEKLENGNIVIQAHDYGNFEKVGDLGFSLPTNDEQITTKPGDLILYQGNQITLYYDTNTWSFTKLGKVLDVSEEELRQILGDGDVTMELKK